MKVLMFLGSLAMIGSGIFCFANGGAAFISVALIIGFVFLAMGLVEVIIGTRADIEMIEEGVSLTSDGVIMFLFGLIIVSGQVTDDVTAEMLFALWMLIEGVAAISRDFKSFFDEEDKDNAEMILGFAMTAISIYIFFNTKLIDINAIVLVGASMLILGMRRFRMAFDVVYNKHSFLTGNEERLEEAMAEEKKALAKAKEGIKEQKAAQRRIEKIKENMVQERNILTETALRKRAAEIESRQEKQ